jgi:hypothetical protein
MKDARERDHAQKRGGGQELFALDAEEGERRYVGEPEAVKAPEALYDRAWAMAVLDTAMDELGEAEKAAGKGRQFEVLVCFLSPEGVVESSYEAAAKELGLKVEAVRKAVSRLREKFRDCLRRQIASTLQDPTEAQVDEELTALKAALRS